MTYDAERVAQLRHMLRDARKRKLSGGLAARRRPPSGDANGVKKAPQRTRAGLWVRQSGRGNDYSPGRLQGAPV
jgi:hypothetical protein